MSAQRPKLRLALLALLTVSALSVGLGACTSSHTTAPPDAALVDAGVSHDAGRPDSAVGVDAGERRDCKQPSDCVVVPRTCCGVCGGPSVSDITAIRKDALPARDQRCRLVPCPKCAQMLNPYLIATCTNGQCEAIDIATRDATSHCQKASDCQVRVTSCCECGGDTSPFSLIAISNVQAYTKLVCDAPTMACPECAPVYPSNVSAVCKADAHCGTVVK